MTEFDTITLTHDEGIARLTLNRPEANNAMSMLFFEEFGRAVGEIAGLGSKVRAVLISSTGRFFSVGGDISLFGANVDELPPLILQGTYLMHPALARLSRIDAPVIAAVQGTAMGGAVAVLSTCDLIVSARSAKFGAAYSQIGLSLDLGASFGLASRMGISRARRFLLLGEVLSAEDAQSAGLVDEVVDDAGLVEAADALARKLSQGPTRAYGEVRRLLARALANPFESQLEDEAQALARGGATADAREGITAFLEKRSAVFRGE